MNKTVKISSKNQITIPAELAEQFNMEKGDRLTIIPTHDGLLIRKSAVVLEELAGSIHLPDELIGLPTDQIISEAKKQYVHKKYGSGA